MGSPSPPRNTGSQQGDNKSDDGWSMINPTSSEEPLSVSANTKRKRVVSPQELARAASHSSNIGRMKQMIVDVSSNLQGMLPSIGESETPRTFWPPPMNYVKTTRPTVTPGTVAQAPVLGTTRRPSKIQKRSPEKVAQIHRWIDAVTREDPNAPPSIQATKEGSPSAQQQQDQRQPSPERECDVWSEYAAEFLSYSGSVDELARGVRSMKTGSQSRSTPQKTVPPSSHAPNRGRELCQTPGTGDPATPTDASVAASSGDLSVVNSSGFVGRSENMTAGVVLGYARGTVRAGEDPKADSQEAAQFTDVSLCDEAADSNLRKLSPHVTPYRKGNRPKPRRPEGYFDGDILQGDDDAVKRGRSRTHREDRSSA